ncbi:hypothetical protein E1A91_A13G161100v1 [Gossypium mustelinum]|uniref:Uncharacterized protein n=1 Tax=Gossypium mustelinum TaxID=34275 RepID=A0A5D2WI73_GOSMU|nr:hypothetical protein E1A91_A13G161100v1 [Gossypium mustelinum]
MYRFQSPKKQFPINHSLFRFLFIFSTKRPLSDNCQSGSFLFCRSISKVYCLRILSISYASASAANREATSLWIFVLKPSTFPDAFLVTTPETDFAQEASKVASKLTL